MTTILKYLFYLPLFGLLFYGCSGSEATILTYINPSLHSPKITSVVVFPLRNAVTQQNASLATGDMIEINKMFQVEFANKNSNTKMLNPTSSTELLNKYNLVNSYDTLLTGYSNANIPNTQILIRIGQNINVDAIIQGFVIKVFQRDGVFAVSYQNPGNRGETKLILKYVMFSTISGEVLWEATCEGHKDVSSLKKAPSISDMIELMRDKIISALPTL